ncbi:CHA4-like protein [Saccharomyces eubayanus]|uniref:CHA4-like protein n=1 Tax=Saccharomyces eubayanus TaxID=1080349 RepID=UPI0006C24CB2|nr:CHA4-like protein [Saccharomyces eubayanus]KOH01333.1 CHA4-like protein [Saccharomyces eubayanus]
MGVTCVPVYLDCRKIKRNKGYVKALENYAVHLENSLVRMKETNNNDIRQDILDSVSLDSSLHSIPQETQAPVPSTADSIENGTTQFYIGPIIPGSSAFPNESLAITSNQLPPGVNEEDSGISSDKYRTLARSPFIILSLSLFFKWLYPSHYFFVYREALLSAFFQDKHSKSYYCSEELIYAIVALGSKITNKSDELYRKSVKYYSFSKQIVLKKVFQTRYYSSGKLKSSSSKLALIQSLLCLAFYDMGRGENSSAWYFSGLAFRIVHEIGLHLDPAALSGAYEGDLTQMDIEVRVRIYWGCYLVDHFMAELYGKSTILRLSNSTVPETDELPDIKEGFEEYMYSDPDKPLLVATPVKRLIVLSRIAELYANESIIPSKSISERKKDLSDFNRDIQQWRLNLPKELAWTTETLTTEEDFDPTISFVWYHYYMVLISYNKPFVSDFNESRQLIEDVITDLFYLLKNWISKYHTFEKCSIQMVTTAILALQCINSEKICNRYYGYFINFLKSPTINYEFSPELFEDKAAESLCVLNLSDDTNLLLNDNSDLSLLSEIDALINKHI